ncbi:hypothetical protein FRC12_001308 [Ceratobasidium sp. 428]|nr:hypothetical protein FRC12_001308 [Ceratobasidium sp. 428]
MSSGTSPVTKKRKLSTGNDPSWSKRQAAAFVEEVEGLQTELEDCHAPALVRALVDSLDDCQPQTIRMFKALVDPILKANKEPKHCVRCHSTYQEVENRSNSCIVFCGSSVSFTGWYDKDGRHVVKMKCCGRTRKEKEKVEADIVCYRARHTVNADDVKYFTDSSEKANKGEKGAKPHGYNPGVLTCADFGCDDEGSELSDPSDEESS